MACNQYFPEVLNTWRHHLHGKNSRLIPLLLVSIPGVVHQHSDTLLQLWGNGRVGSTARGLSALDHLIASKQLRVDVSVSSLFFSPSSCPFVQSIDLS